MAFFDRPRPVTAEQAGEHLGRSPVTIRTWVTRFNAQRLGSVGKVMYYDLRDLVVIERETRNGRPVPPTARERVELRGEHFNAAA